MLAKEFLEKLVFKGSNIICTRLTGLNRHDKKLKIQKLPICLTSPVANSQWSHRITRRGLYIYYPILEYQVVSTHMVHALHCGNEGIDMN